MSGKRLTPADDAAIFALRRAGKTIKAIAEIRRHSTHTVMRVLGTLKGHKDKKRAVPGEVTGPCVECGTKRGPFFFRGGGIRCVKHAARAVAAARKVT